MDRPALKTLRPIRPAPVPPEVLFADGLTRGDAAHLGIPGLQAKDPARMESNHRRSESFARLRHPEIRPTP